MLRFSQWCMVCVSLLIAETTIARAQQPQPASRAPAVKTEIGEINGASFRIDMPADWNGGLVIVNHGYSVDRVVHRAGNLRGLPSLLAGEGFAIAQSGYAAGGWAIEEAVTDNENLRRYFIGKYGEPKELYAAGGAMGAYVAMTMLEKLPSTYDGALSYSGPLSSYRVKSFDTRVLFDYYFPGVMPPLDQTPVDYRYGGESDRKFRDALESNREKAEIVRRYSGLKNLADLARRLSFNTYTLRELQIRSGGNPFDNRGVIYNVDDDLVAVNAGVARYAADPKALDYMRAWGSPTGQIRRPLLAVHTIYDPISDTDRIAPYLQLTFQAGTQDLFVQQYVNSEGHGGIAADVLLQSFHQLRDWCRTGKQPPAGLTR